MAMEQFGTWGALQRGAAGLSSPEGFSSQHVSAV